MRLAASLRVMLVALGAAVLSASTVQAQKAAAAKPAAAKAKNEMRMPKTATARCGDSTWSKAASQQGACSQHGGVAFWVGKSKSKKG
jgi:hypothetical protein